MTLDLTLTLTDAIPAADLGAAPVGLQTHEIKLRKLDKKKGFHAFSEEEKKQYLKLIAPLGGGFSDPSEDPGSRAITALDDFMQSMKYVEDLVQEPRCRS